MGQSKRICNFHYPRFLCWNHRFLNGYDGVTFSFYQRRGNLTHY